MIQLSYVLKRIATSNYSEMFKAADRVAKKTGKSKLTIYKDMLSCISKHETGYLHYDIYKLYDMTEAERSRFLSVGRNNRLVKALNDLEDSKLLDNKIMFNRRYSDYIKREWLELDGHNKEAFMHFCDGKEAIMAKPVSLGGGEGITKIWLKDEKDLSALYDRLIKKQCFLVEEVAVQCPEMNVLCTTSINTIRVITLIKKDGDPVIAAAAVRFGREGNFVDNFHSHGMAAIIDVKTGKTITDGYDINREMYQTVPILGTAIKGFQVPHWPEICKLVKAAARISPKIRYVGWDVCLSKDYGPCLIEGNSYPGQDVTQYPELNIGTYDAFKQILENEI